MADFPVKWISSEFRGAPVINGQAGSLLGALKAFLIDGFGEITPSSVVVSGGVATATHGASDFFEDYAVIKIRDADDADLNGEARVLNHTSTTTSWSTEAEDGAATGTIKIRYAPVGGWEEVYSKTNVSVFASTNALAGGFLRVDDTVNQYARVRAYEAMSDVDNGSGAFPDDTQMSGGGYWYKSLQNNAAPVSYTMVGTSIFFVHAIGYYYSADASYIAGNPRGFGNFIPIKTSGDGYCIGLSYAGSNMGNEFNGCLDASVARWNASNGGTVMMRNHDGSGASIAVEVLPFIGTAPRQSGYSTSAPLGAYSSDIDGAVRASPVFVTTASGSSAATPRAIVPLVYHIPQSGVSGALTHRELVDIDINGVTRKFIFLLNTGNMNATNQLGGFLVDITGP